MTANKLSVLLIDDDEVDIMFVNRAFKKRNISVNLKIVSNGVDALSLLNTMSPKSHFFPDIIILDIMMPKMNGIEFLKELREHSQFDHVRILILTTSRNERDISAAKELNVAGYYIKQTDFEDFLMRFCHLMQPEVPSSL